jgi:hypothetical protein
MKNINMNRFQQSERLLKAFKLDSLDEYNIALALELIEKYGDFTKVIHESLDDRYNRLRYTPDVLLQSLLGKDLGEYDNLEKLSEKLYSLQNAAYTLAEKNGKTITEQFAEINIVETLELTIEEAWTLYYAGGKDFIIKMTNMRDGEAVIARLKESYNKALNHISQSTKHSLTQKKIKQIENKNC